MARRIALVGLGVAALWLAALVVAGIAMGEAQAVQIAARVGESLQGSATVAGVDVALVRGQLTIDDLAVHRDDAVGHLALDVHEVRCELAAFGAALLDRSCRELAVRGVRLEVSSPALFHIQQRERRPIHAEHVAIDDAVLAFAPAALAATAGPIAIRVAHADAGPTLLRTPLSWVFALETLDAMVQLPAGLAVHLTYADGELAATGTLFGATPVRVPVELPDPGSLADGHDELRALVTLGEQLAEALVAKRAADWLGSKL